MSEREMPNPTQSDLADPLFEAIWQAVKTWDVNVPEYYTGYCGLNGSHVMLILTSVRAALADRPEPAQPVAHWRHVKRGTTYVTAGQAMAQCSTGPINDGDTTQVYRGADGGLYVRKVEEFQDGRFERIAAPVARPERRQRR